MERLSSIKRTTIGGGNNPHPCLAVFPLQIEFTNAVDYSTVIYFEKNYQVLGDLKTTIPPNKKNRRHLFTSGDNLFTFKMISVQNLTYKWSLYRKYDSGQQQFIESFLVDLKTFLADQVTAVRSSLIGTSIDALNLPASIEKQLVAKFSNGMKLKFMFVAVEDVKTAEEIAQSQIAALKFIRVNEEEEPKNNSETPSPVQNQGNSQANIDVSSKVDTEKTQKDPSSNPEIPSPSTEVTPEQEKKQKLNQTPKEAPKEVKAEEKNVAPSTETKADNQVKQNKTLNMEKVTSIVDIDLLKVQSQREEVRVVEEEKKEGQNLQMISQEPEKFQNTEGNPYTPEDPPEKVVNAAPEQARPQPLEEIKEKVVSTLNSSMNIQIDLKKVIILLLVVIIGMMVLLWPKENKEKTSKKQSKKAKRK